MRASAIGGLRWAPSLLASELEELIHIDQTEDRQDGMTIDVCGNLYVVKQLTGIVRVTTEGDVDVIDLDITDTPIAANNFGSGVGGWEADHLYVQSYDGVYELDIGVPGRPEPFLEQ